MSAIAISQNLSISIKPHPAKFTDRLLPVMADMLDGASRILDPFGGTGKIFRLYDLGISAQIFCVEIEPEWAAHDSRTLIGDATALVMFQDGSFDAICTSPCYGNRMADSHVAKDKSQRNTYTHKIGRKLHENNAGAMQWGEDYRRLHALAWAECRRILCNEGTFVLNIKNHIRSSKSPKLRDDLYAERIGETKSGTPTYLVDVTQWHIDFLSLLDFNVIRHEKIECPGNRYGQNGESRVDYESIIEFSLIK